MKFSYERCWKEENEEKSADRWNICKHLIVITEKPETSLRLLEEPKKENLKGNKKIGMQNKYTFLPPQLIWFVSAESRFYKAPIAVILEDILKR